MLERVCDPSLLTAFVRGDLNTDAEHDLTAHLDECETCGQLATDVISAIH